MKLSYFRDLNRMNLGSNRDIRRHIYTTYRLLRTLEPSVPTVGIYKKTPIRLQRCLTLIVTVGDLAIASHLRRTGHKKKTPKKLIFEVSEKRRRPTLPRCNAVPSARVGLTSLFGMGRGGTPLL